MPPHTTSDNSEEVRGFLLPQESALELEITGNNRERGGFPSDALERDPGLGVNDSLLLFFFTLTLQKT